MADLGNDFREIKHVEKAFREPQERVVLDDGDDFEHFLEAAQELIEGVARREENDGAKIDKADLAAALTVFARGPKTEEEAAAMLRRIYLERQGGKEKQAERAEKIFAIIDRLLPRVINAAGTSVAYMFNVAIVKEYLQLLAKKGADAFGKKGERGSISSTLGEAGVVGELGGVAEARRQQSEVSESHGIYAKLMAERKFARFQQEETRKQARALLDESTDDAQKGRDDTRREAIKNKLIQIELGNRKAADEDLGVLNADTDEGKKLLEARNAMDELLNGKVKVESTEVFEVNKEDASGREQKKGVVYIMTDKRSKQQVKVLRSEDNKVYLVDPDNGRAMESGFISFRDGQFYALDRRGDEIANITSECRFTKQFTYEASKRESKLSMDASMRPIFLRAQEEALARDIELNLEALKKNQEIDESVSKDAQNLYQAGIDASRSFARHMRLLANAVPVFGSPFSLLVKALFEAPGRAKVQLESVRALENVEVAGEDGEKERILSGEYKKHRATLDAYDTLYGTKKAFKKEKLKEKYEKFKQLYNTKGESSLSPQEEKLYAAYQGHRQLEDVREQRREIEHALSVNIFDVAKKDRLLEEIAHLRHQESELAKAYDRTYLENLTATLAGKLKRAGFEIDSRDDFKNGVDQLPRIKRKQIARQVAHNAWETVKGFVLMSEMQKLSPGVMGKLPGFVGSLTTASVYIGQSLAMGREIGSMDSISDAVNLVVKTDLDKIIHGNSLILETLPAQHIEIKSPEDFLKAMEQFIIARATGLKDCFTHGIPALEQQAERIIMLATHADDVVKGGAELVFGSEAYADDKIRQKAIFNHLDIYQKLIALKIDHKRANQLAQEALKSGKLPEELTQVGYTEKDFQKASSAVTEYTQDFLENEKVAARTAGTEEKLSALSAGKKFTPRTIRAAQDEMLEGGFKAAAKYLKDGQGGTVDSAAEYWKVRRTLDDLYLPARCLDAKGKVVESELQTLTFAELAQASVEKNCETVRGVIARNPRLFAELPEKTREAALNWMEANWVMRGRYGTYGKLTTEQKLLQSMDDTIRFGSGLDRDGNDSRTNGVLEPLFRRYLEQPGGKELLAQRFAQVKSIAYRELTDIYQIVEGERGIKAVNGVKVMGEETAMDVLGMRVIRLLMEEPQQQGNVEIGDVPVTPLPADIKGPPSSEKPVIPVENANVEKSPPYPVSNPPEIVPTPDGSPDDKEKAQARFELYAQVAGEIEEAEPTVVGEEAIIALFERYHIPLPDRPDPRQVIEALKNTERVLLSRIETLSGQAREKIEEELATVRKALERSWEGLRDNEAGAPVRILERDMPPDIKDVCQRLKEFFGGSGNGVDAKANVSKSGGQINAFDLVNFFQKYADGKETIAFDDAEAWLDTQVNSWASEVFVGMEGFEASKENGDIQARLAELLIMDVRNHFLAWMKDITYTDKDGKKCIHIDEFVSGAADRWRSSAGEITAEWEAAEKRGGITLRDFLFEKLNETIKIKCTELGGRIERGEITGASIKDLEAIVDEYGSLFVEYFIHKTETDPDGTRRSEYAATAAALELLKEQFRLKIANAYWGEDGDKRRFLASIPHEAKDKQPDLNFKYAIEVAGKDFQAHLASGFAEFDLKAKSGEAEFRDFLVKTVDESVKAEFALLKARMEKGDLRELTADKFNLLVDKYIRLCTDFTRFQKGRDERGQMVTTFESTNTYLNLYGTLLKGEFHAGYERASYEQKGSVTNAALNGFQATLDRLGVIADGLKLNWDKLGQGRFDLDQFRAWIEGEREVNLDVLKLYVEKVQGGEKNIVGGAESIHFAAGEQFVFQGKVEFSFDDAERRGVCTILTPDGASAIIMDVEGTTSKEFARRFGDGIDDVRSLDDIKQLFGEALGPQARGKLRLNIRNVGELFEGEGMIDLVKESMRVLGRDPGVNDVIEFYFENGTSDELDEFVVKLKEARQGSREAMDYVVDVALRKVTGYVGGTVEFAEHTMNESVLFALAKRRLMDKFAQEGWYFKGGYGQTNTEAGNVRIRTEGWEIEAGNVGEQFAWSGRLGQARMDITAGFIDAYAPIHAKVSGDYTLIGGSAEVDTKLGRIKLNFDGFAFDKKTIEGIVQGDLNGDHVLAVPFEVEGGENGTVFVPMASLEIVTREANIVGIKIKGGMLSVLTKDFIEGAHQGDVDLGGWKILKEYFGEIDTGGFKGMLRVGKNGIESVIHCGKEGGANIDVTVIDHAEYLGKGKKGNLIDRLRMRFGSGKFGMPLLGDDMQVEIRGGFHQIPGGRRVYDAGLDATIWEKINLRLSGQSVEGKGRPTVTAQVGVNF